MYFAPFAAALLVGALLAVQAVANQQLNRAVGTPYGASTLQLSVATAALVVLASLTGALGALAAVPDVRPWWLLLGGVASPLYITAGILLFPRLGALTSVGLFVTGQVFASLALDVLGLLGIPVRPLGLGLGLGAAAVLIGIVVIIRSQRARVPAAGGPGTTTRDGLATGPAARPGWIALGMLAGAVLPVQGAVNAQLRVRIDAPLAVASISFAVALLTIAVVLVVLLVARRTPTPQLRGLPGMLWWGWLGGFCAAAYVTATFLLIPVIGAALTVALTVTGQQLASAAIDQRGAFRLPRRPVTPARLAGLVLLVAGVALVQLS